MATMTISSSKYKDIISKSIRIQAGPPAVYQLIPKKEKFGTLIRMTVGEKNPNKPNKTILLVGETGAGKSTLINVLFNYTMGVKWEDEVWFQITEQKKESQSESQTSDVIVYEIFDVKDQTLPYSLTIIDTPGYGNTRGIEHDDIISHRLLDLFQSEDGVHEVDAVCLVMKATDNRVSDRLKYVLDSVTSLFGKEIEKNIIALITHSNGKKPKNALQAIEAANIKCARNEENQPVYFLFDNCQNEDRTEEEEHTNVISEREMRKFTVFLENTSPQKLKKTVEVINDRIRLTACIQNLKERIKLTELKQTEIKQIQEALKKHEEEVKEIMEFNVEVDVVYREKEPLKNKHWWNCFWWGSQGAVCCNVCKENCHYPCTIALKQCKVMKEGHCTVCIGKCHVSNHVKENSLYKPQTKKQTMTAAEIKQKYEANKSESESILENLEKEMIQLTAEKSQFLDESYQHVVRLEQIALKADSASTNVHLDFLSEKMKEKGDTEKVKKLEEMRSREDEGTRAAQLYMRNKLKEKKTPLDFPDC